MDQLFSLFADGIPVDQLVENVCEAEAFLHLLRRLFDALQEWSITPKLNKTVILCRLRGKGVPNFLLKYRTVLGSDNSPTVTPDRRDFRDFMDMPMPLQSTE